MSRNFFDPNTAQNPFTGGGTPNQLIDQLIGTSYETVKIVAANLDDILIVANFIKAAQKAVPAPPSSSMVYPVDLTTVPAVFNFEAAFIQQVNLDRNVASSMIIGQSAGYSIVVLRFIQDATGGRTFAWPAGINSHGDIATTPNAISQQMFAKNVSMTFDPIGAMIYPNG